MSFGKVGSTYHEWLVGCKHPFVAYIVLFYLVDGMYVVLHPVVGDDDGDGHWLEE